ncbi:dihydrofolate reductase family protein [Tsukamurella soli]|uniref:Dihydrofolate reductase family protein n=1 Tax=Tsukamurella soli TaxID=644556 RepID=A0ABP8JZK5_9ACTN
MTGPVIVDLFLSVDGWAKGVDSPGYFGYGGPDLRRWIADAAASEQRVLLGRRTYEAFEALPLEFRDEGYRRMAQTPTTVFSRTLSEAAWPAATVTAHGPVEYVRAWRGSRLRTMGSLSIARQLLDAGVVDRLRLLVFPCLVGDRGREAPFDSVRSADLEVVEQRLLDGRIVFVEYRPTGRPAPPA